MGNHKRPQPQPQAIGVEHIRQALRLLDLAPPHVQDWNRAQLETHLEEGLANGYWQGRAAIVRIVAASLAAGMGRANRQQLRRLCAQRGLGVHAWISTAEALPVIGERVLLAELGHEYMEVGAYRPDRPDPWRDGDDRRIVFQVTHWCRLDGPR